MQGTKDEDACVVGLAYFPSDYVRKFVVLVTTKHYCTMLFCLSYHNIKLLCKIRIMGGVGWSFKSGMEVLGPTGRFRSGMEIHPKALEK